ncbi:MAG TPA: response regulator [Stellaceae bacterium]|nr:response regulator [Stellaceae bacterium]
MASAFTILLVEDDSTVRDYVVQLLREKAIAALVAADGMAALQLLAAHHVDVLFTDIVMPGMSGLDLAKEAKRLRPAIRILFSTGWPGKSVDHGALRLGPVLLKPWREGELLHELRRLGWSG